MNTADLFDIAFSALERRKDPPVRSNPGTVLASLRQKDVPADLRTAEVGTLARCKSCGAPMYALYDSCTQCLMTQAGAYPVRCRARYYDAASTILEDELPLFSHDNANELGQVIEQWIAQKRENWEPR